jgi:hypothetical protein
VSCCTGLEYRLGPSRTLPRSAREAGFEVAAISGSFGIGDAELFEIHAGTLAAARGRGTQLGIAAERIDGLVRDIRAAKGVGYQWVSSPYYLDLALRKPAVV